MLVPAVGACNSADVRDVIPLVPAPVGVLVPEKNVIIAARGAAGAATGEVKASDLFAPIVASMLVSNGTVITHT